jgi:hypothetical protein
VEAMCNQIAGKQNASLGDALKHIEGKTKAPVHGALKEAFSRLYGWTSDAKGIRHANAYPEDRAEFEDERLALGRHLVGYMRVRPNCWRYRAHLG